ncbi:MAG: hypothetical protein MZW92_54185 [Comamonadaceae bacterium]|nr:hypothetical protein [Comamonadaceae bacterium]
MTVGQQLFGAFSAVLLLTTVLGVVAVLGLRSVDAQRRSAGCQVAQGRGRAVGRAAPCWWRRATSRSSTAAPTDTQLLRRVRRQDEGGRAARSARWPTPTRSMWPRRGRAGAVRRRSARPGPPIVPASSA